MPAELSLGATVRVLGLTADLEHNGSTGHLIKFRPEKGRWKVKIEDKQETLALKPANLELVFLPPGVPDLDADAVKFLAEHGVTIKQLPVLGAEVVGLDLRSTKDSEIVTVLEQQMASRGYLVFRGQGVMSGDEQVAASELFGGKRVHSTHGVHPKAPNEHIFRLSNDKEHGILGVGPQWHNDGSFERAIFSHTVQHIIRVPEHGGATTFSHQGAAHDALSPEEQEQWSRRVSVNSNSGVVHPMVHQHPISGRKSVWLHLGMTGAVLEMKKGVEKVERKEEMRLLEEHEMSNLFNRYNELLNNGAYSRDHAYEVGDFVIFDNLAVGHRATKQAHASASVQGLRIVHRTTVAGVKHFDPPPKFGLPHRINVEEPSPFGKGVFIGGGLGYRWDPHIHMQN